MPSNLDSAYLASRDFEKQFGPWVNEVRAQCHVFFGYSGKAQDTANRIHLWLQENGLKVLDWNYFRPAESIFSRLEQAADRVSCGLFLLTADDVKIKNNQLGTAPRDNVIFEAGYFARAKGKERTLIILEEGVDLLTDLGGDIYLSLGRERDSAMIEGRLTRYFEAILNEHLPYADKY
jgi:predicted nucleotide-binding protein